jgi:tetratricopeptide (TPR) repeat protein
MGLLDDFLNYFKGKPSGVEGLTAVQQSFVQASHRLVDVVNESLKLANESNVVETKLARLAVAKDKLEDLKKICADHKYIKILTLGEVEVSIRCLEIEFEAAGYANIAQMNARGESLEKSADVSGAINVYEELVAQRVDTPFTYRRLCIVYKKLKKRDDELRIIGLALQNIPEKNSAHRYWFAERLAKVK